MDNFGYVYRKTIECGWYWSYWDDNL